MKTTMAIVHDHQGRVKDGREAMLEIRLTTDRRTQYISTGVRVRKNEWMAGRVVNRLDASSLNERLGTICEKVHSVLNLAFSRGESPDVKVIRNAVFAVREEALSETPLTDWIEEQIPQLPVSEGTRKHYWTLAVRLREWGRMPKWEDATAERVSELDTWLRERRKPVCEAASLAGVSGDRLEQSSIYNYHKNLRALLGRAERFGKIDRNPYSLLRGQFKRGDKENVEYLTADEMRAVRDLPLPRGSALDVARDLFCFQMYTGLSYSDAVAFDFSAYRMVGGTWRCVGRRIKTGVPYVSELLPPAVAVLEKYGGKVPRVNNADYNHRLKEIGAQAGIRARMHSHLARHTFATWMLASGAKIENVARMLGHTNIQQTERYAKVLAQSVHEDFERVRKDL
jgi:integrase